MSSRDQQKTGYSTGSKRKAKGISSLAGDGVESEVVRVKIVTDGERDLLRWTANNKASDSVQGWANAANEAEIARHGALVRIVEASSAIADVELNISRLEKELEAAKAQRERLQRTKMSLQLQVLRSARIASEQRDKLSAVAQPRGPQVSRPITRPVRHRHRVQPGCTTPSDYDGEDENGAADEENDSY